MNENLVTKRVLRRNRHLLLVRGEKDTCYWFDVYYHHGEKEIYLGRVYYSVLLSKQSLDFNEDYVGIIRYRHILGTKYGYTENVIALFDVNKEMFIKSDSNDDLVAFYKQVFGYTQEETEFEETLLVRKKKEK